jgi:hypothetical protein
LDPCLGRGDHRSELGVCDRLRLIIQRPQSQLLN